MAHGHGVNYEIAGNCRGIYGFCSLLADWSIYAVAVGGTVIYVMFNSWNSNQVIIGRNELGPHTQCDDAISSGVDFPKPRPFDADISANKLKQTNHFDQMTRSQTINIFPDVPMTVTHRPYACIGAGHRFHFKTKLMFAFLHSRTTTMCCTLRPCTRAKMW